MYVFSLARLGHSVVLYLLWHDVCNHRLVQYLSIRCHVTEKSKLLHDKEGLMLERKIGGGGGDFGLFANNFQSSFLFFCFLFFFFFSSV